jgi:hypothetical protein
MSEECCVCDDMSECSFPVYGNVYQHQLPACNHIVSWILQHGFPLGPTPSDRHTLGSLLVNVTGTSAVVLC